jgi:hypothetical protein
MLTFSGRKAFADVMLRTLKWREIILDYPSAIT